jgi:hypothetical protein
VLLEDPPQALYHRILLALLTAFDITVSKLENWTNHNRRRIITEIEAFATESCDAEPILFAKTVYLLAH